MEYEISSRSKNLYEIKSSQKSTALNKLKDRRYE